MLKKVLAIIFQSFESFIYKLCKRSVLKKKKWFCL